MCTHLRNSLDPWRAFKLSVVSPFLRRNRSVPSSQLRSNKDKKANIQRVESRKQRRRAGLKRRFESITSNPLHLASIRDEPLETNYIFDGLVADNGERESDDDFEDDQEPLSADHYLDDADEDFENLQPVRQVLKYQEEPRASRRDRITCELKQSADDRFRYTATFINLKNRAPPPPQSLFGSKYSYIKDWKKVFDHDPQYWTFVSSEDVRKVWTSGKQFLRELGEIINITEDMLNTDQV
jgi:hypothetical protein